MEMSFTERTKLITLHRNKNTSLSKQETQECNSYKHNSKIRKISDLEGGGWGCNPHLPCLRDTTKTASAPRKVIKKILVHGRLI